MKGEASKRKRYSDRKVLKTRPAHKVFSFWYSQKYLSSI
jgi:hypothetical protein